MTDVVVKWGKDEIRGHMLRTSIGPDPYAGLGTYGDIGYDRYGYWQDPGSVWNFSVYVPPKPKPEDLDMPNVGEFYD